MRIGIRPNYIILNYICQADHHDLYQEIVNILSHFNVKLDSHQQQYLEVEYTEIENDLNMPESFINAVDHHKYGKISDYIGSRSMEDSILDLKAFRKLEGMSNITHPELEICAVEEGGVFWTFSYEDYDQIVSDHKNPYTLKKLERKNNWTNVKSKERIMKRLGLDIKRSYKVVKANERDFIGDLKLKLYG